MSDDKKIVPGGWEVDEHGRRFRRMGNCIEYAMTVQTMAGEVYFDDLDEHNRRMKEQAEERRQAEIKALQAGITERNCPFKMGRNLIKISCEKSCTFYMDTSCAFANMNTRGIKDTKGTGCIIAGRCNERCAMYNEGCTLINMFMDLKSGKE